MKKVKKLKLTSSHSYNYWIERFHSFADGRILTTKVVREFLEELKYNNASNSCRRLVKFSLQKGFQLTLAPLKDYNGISELEEFLKNYDIPKMRTKVTSADVLTLEQFIKFNNHATLRQKIINSVLWETAARINEVLSIKHRDCIIKDEKVIATVKGKGGSNIELRFSASLYQKARREFQGSVYLFESDSKKRIASRSVQGYMQKLSAKFGRKVWPHLIRHSAATHLINMGVSVFEVSQYLHHSSVHTTINVYIHPKADCNSVHSKLELDFSQLYKREVTIKPQATVNSSKSNITKEKQVI